MLSLPTSLVNTVVYITFRLVLKALPDLTFTSWIVYILWPFEDKGSSKVYWWQKTSSGLLVFHTSICSEAVSDGSLRQGEMLYKWNAATFKVKVGERELSSIRKHTFISTLQLVMVSSQNSESTTYDVHQKQWLVSHLWTNVFHKITLPPPPPHTY